MRIRNGRSLASLFLATTNSGGNDSDKDLQFRKQLIGGMVPSIAPLAHCEVNRSPWDVTPLVLAFSNLDHHAPVLREEEGMGSDTPSPSMGPETELLPDSNYAQLDFTDPTAHNPRIVQLPGKGKKLPDATTKNNNSKKKDSGRGENGESRNESYCKRKDGKGWRCGSKAKTGSSFCLHHLSQLRSYCSKKPANDNQNAPNAGRGELGISSKKRHFPSSKGEDGDCYYYYYTGYGPARRETKRNSCIFIEMADDDGFNNDDDEDIDEGEVKTRRKRVKCRSLKSLL